MKLRIYLIYFSFLISFQCGVTARIGNRDATISVTCRPYVHPVEVFTTFCQQLWKLAPIFLTYNLWSSPRIHESSFGKYTKISRRRSAKSQIQNIPHLLGTDKFKGTRAFATRETAVIKFHHIHPHPEFRTRSTSMRINLIVETFRRQCSSHSETAVGSADLPTQRLITNSSPTCIPFKMLRFLFVSGVLGKGHTATPPQERKQSCNYRRTGAPRNPQKVSITLCRLCRRGNLHPQKTEQPLHNLLKWYPSTAISNTIA